VVAADEPGTVPNVVGLSAREATRKLAQFGIAPRMDGDGFVTRQDPAPGTPVTAATVCRLTLDRGPVRLTASAGQP
jgi:beta-lactam-binding protein with PASTA domain